MEERRFTDVGGTPGGLGHFLLGFAMACVGAYLLMNQVVVAGSYWNFYGPGTFGITLIPMLIGVGLLFWNGRSVIGWLLTVVGALIIVVGIISNLQIYFRPSSLFDTLMILGLMAGGIGLVAKSLREPTTKEDTTPTR